MAHYKPLKWDINNFDFYYEGSKIKDYSDLNTEIYNKKFKDLLDNDEELCYNYNVLTDKWKWVLDRRVTFKEFIEKELEVVVNEIKKADDLLDFLEWYIQNTGKCNINLIDDSLLDFTKEEDSVIYIKNATGDIIGVLLPDGTMGDYDRDVYGTPESNPNSTVIVDPSGTGNIKNLSFCDGKEILLVEKEYDFC